MHRRDLLGTLGTVAMAGAVGVPLSAAVPSAGRLRQSVARWCYGSTPIHDLCATAKTVGLMGIDLLGPDEWSVPLQYGLECTMGNSWGTIPVGFNRRPITTSSWPTVRRTFRARPPRA